MKNLREVENMDFAYTTISLNKTYQMGFDQALQVIERNGGSVSGDEVTIKCQQPVAVRYEKAFECMYPIEKVAVNKNLPDVGELPFEGTGAVFKGFVNAKDDKYVARVEMYLDGEMRTFRHPIRLVGTTCSGSISCPRENIRLRLNG